jgi:hypothetical protein
MSTINKEVPGRLVGSVEDVVFILDSNRDDVYELLRTGQIESFLDGRRRKILLASVETYVARRLKASKQFEPHRHPVRRPDGVVQTGIGAKQPPA